MRGADGHDTLFLEGNLALVFLTTGRHEAAARIGESLLGHNQLLRMPWLQAFSESIVGFYKISVGAFHEAEALAETVHHVIGNRKYLVSDQSYIESFLAKVDAIRGERQTALQRLAAAQTALAPVNFVGSLRVGLDRIEILSILNPSSASDELLKLRVAAQRAGAFPLVERMDALRTEWGG
jgi:hypothetical protein